MLIHKEKLIDCLCEDKEIIFEDCLHNSETRFKFLKSEVENYDAKVLAICHLDTVQRLPNPKDVVINSHMIHSSCLDDRLGYYILKHKLWEDGVHADLLFTDNEESGFSTAEFFGQADRYNWIVEFDRGGEDVVTYGNDSVEFLEALESVGFRIGVGAFSDIVSLDTSLCSFNVGIGYHKAHEINSYAFIHQLENNYNKFLDFYFEYEHQMFFRDIRSKDLYGYPYDWYKGVTQYKVPANSHREEINKYEGVDIKENSTKLIEGLTVQEYLESDYSKEDNSWYAKGI